VADLSFEQIRDKVNQALLPKTDDGPWIYVMDTYPSYVITNEGDKYFKVSYSINVDGTVAIGEKTEVVRTYSEVAKAAALELAKKAADEADDEEGKEGDDTCSHCGGEMADGKCKGCDKSADECTCEKQDGKEANPDDEEGKAGEGEPDGDEGKGAKKGARASKGKAADMGAAGDQGLGSRTSMNFSGVGHDILKPVQDLVAAFPHLLREEVDRRVHAIDLRPVGVLKHRNAHRGAPVPAGHGVGQACSCSQAACHLSTGEDRVKRCVICYAPRRQPRNFARTCRPTRRPDQHDGASRHVRHGGRGEPAHLHERRVFRRPDLDRHRGVGGALLQGAPGRRPAVGARPVGARSAGAGRQRLPSSTTGAG
jgi:hypothetical protein